MLNRIDRGIMSAAIVAAPIFIAIVYFAGQVTPPFDPAWPLSYPKHFLFLIFLVPIIEEFFFRGTLQPYLLQKLSKRYLSGHLSLANLITSVLFAALHLLQHSLLWSAATFFPSLIFGWLRERTGKTWPAIALHVYYNFSYFYLFNGL